MIANGLSRISTLMALEARNTMKKASIATGTSSPLPSHERSIAARKPVEPGKAASGSAGGNTEMTNGTKAPVAISPLILCARASATSSGFFKSRGAVRPTVSFRKQAVTSTKAGIQNHGLRKPGQAGALLRRLGVKIPPRPDGASAQQRGDGDAGDLGDGMGQLCAWHDCICRCGRFRRSRSPSCGWGPAAGGQGNHGGQ